MAEAGGASTQAGIFFQNTIAALALADLLELAPMPPRERVVEVRLEAPTEVDDVVVTYADGHRDFQNIKTDVAIGSPAWRRLWESLHAQFNAASFGEDDQLTIVLPELTPLARTLRDLCERAATAPEETEWRSRLGNDHRALLERIETSIGPVGSALELLRRTTVSIKSEDQVQDEFNRRRIGGSFSLPVNLLTTLRDIAGSGARKRALHTAAPLRRRLAQYGIDVAEPSEWGLSAYRAAVARLARIRIPGTHMSGPTEELFVWPRVRTYERSRQADFEDELYLHSPDSSTSIIDMRAFPSEHIDRCIVVAGPGHGKSALLVSIAGRLAQGPMVPVLIPLASMTVSGLSITEFLSQQINREFDVKPDWQRLAEQGLLVLLLDGLDEVPVGARPALLQRISTFAARYPTAPWMLTVRDPSVLVGSFEAPVVELLPLNDEDVHRFVETMKQRLSTVDVYAFIHRLRQYPDLSQLARIPLFLSILLATLDDYQFDLPSTRSELIEAYLRTLFSPQAHKGVVSPADRAVPLRKIAETLAFERLEHQEIGASEREVRNVIARFTPNTAEASSLFELLQANGIIRQQSGIRLQFPFPIVQEYLAACHLIQTFPESLAERIDDAIHRPWAQVIQFAIEQHPAPTPILRAMLERGDDAFCTGLRLVGRCIANGARVDPQARQEIGDRLVHFWVRATWNTRDRVGRIIADGFSKPMSETLRKAVHHRWLMHHGAGEIVSSARDRTLTMSVIRGFVQGGLDGFFMYHALKPAINAAASEVFSATLEWLRQSDPTSEQYKGITSLLAHLEQGSMPRAVALDAATDTILSREARLRAYYLAGAPVSADALAIIRDVLTDEDAPENWDALRLLSLHPDRSTALVDLLRSQEISLKQRCKIAADFPRVFLDEPARSSFTQEILAADNLAPEIIDIVRLFAARYGDQVAFQTLVERIPEAELDVATSTVALFGHFPDRVLAERAAALAQIRVHAASDAVRFASNAAIGMLYIFELDFGFGGGLRDTTPHAGIQAWREIVEEWSARNDLSTVQRLSLLTFAARLGSAHSRGVLQAEVLSLTNPDDAAFDDDDYGNAITSAIREARRRGPLLPLELAERFVRSQKPNVPYAGVGAIEAHGTKEALRLMVQLHGEVEDRFAKEALEDAIESTAAKLAVVVRRDGAMLCIPSSL